MSGLNTLYGIVFNFTNMGSNGALMFVWVAILLFLLLSSSMFPSAFLCALLLLCGPLLLMAFEVLADVVGLAGTAVCFGCLYVYFAY